MIVERFGDRSIFTAKRTVRVAFDFDFAKGGGEGTVVDEATQRWFAKTCEELDCFHGLEATNDSGEHAQDTSFGSGWDRTLGRRFGEEAAVTGASEVRG